MPTIGAPLRKWTAFLLLCTLPTSAFAQAANETATAVVDQGATASPSATTQRTSTAPPHAAPSLRSYAERESACPFRTINYITHTLPQQCLRTSWSAPGDAAAANENATAEATPTLYTADTGGREQQKIREEETGSATSLSAPQAEKTGSSGDALAATEQDAELETDSPFDNANFLSFDEWKNRNLARAGQSPENVGQKRAASAEQKPRRRPVNVNALDSLGEEAEIEIDFSGFGTPPADPNSANGAAPGSRQGEAAKAAGEDKAAPSSWALSKDAGKTCKERFNFASFDCAATVLKTNKQAKSSSAVLSEHKDSYMLNECSADNKFLIVELCDDILVDTVVLANYEFFSSMFRHFRVSISDRYPVKMDRWRTLATFEARNSRDIQPFLITEPQIWARYLRIEFLTQYGNEFYCPLSLLRVHGTTMMEQFRRDEEEARGVDDDVELIDAVEGGVVEASEGSGPIPVDQIPIPPVKEDSIVARETVVTPSGTEPAISSETSTPSILADHGSNSTSTTTSQTMVASNSGISAGAQKSASSVDGISVSSPSPIATSVEDKKEPQNSSNATGSSSASAKADVSSSLQIPPDSSVTTSAVTVPRKDSTTPTSINDTASSPSGSPPAKASNNTAASPPVHSSPRSSPTQPSPASPTTQESFFKSIHKRLQYLEANSTLSLQYIEEQSRILRDAFVKVEKRQLAKTEKFLDHLNSTVMQELKSYRNMYDQLWQSTIIELESMKERQNTEIGEIGSRLSLLADELVWQKRMAVVQSTLLLLCLGLVLFARSGTLGASGSDMPIVQQLGTKYSNFFDSPRVDLCESGIQRRRSTFRSMWRSDTSVGLSDRSHHSDPIASDAESDSARSPVQIEFSPPTPNTPRDRSILDSDMEASPRQTNGTALSDHEGDEPDESAAQAGVEMDLEDQAQRIAVLETQSGPATPHGTRDSRPSWEEVDRAMDQLKAEEQGQAAGEAPREAERKQRRSPLRRAHSSYVESMEEGMAGNGSGGGGMLLTASG
jgi:hypothetical protein